MDVIAPQQRPSVMVQGVAQRSIGIAAAPGQDRRAVHDEVASAEQAQAFLDTTDTTVGAPFNATVSGVSLLQAASALMSTHPEEVSAAASTVFQVYDGELNQTTDLQNRLQSEANQLQTDLLTP